VTSLPLAHQTGLTWQANISECLLVAVCWSSCVT